MNRTIVLWVVGSGLSAVLTGCPSGRDDGIRLENIVEIKGYPAPPNLESFGAPRPPPRDVKGEELEQLLEGYVRVANDKAVGSPIGTGDATAVFEDGERPVTFMYITCPGQEAGSALFEGKPHRIVFVVNADFVMFDRKGLCAGFEEKPAPSASRVVPYEAIKEGNLAEVRSSLAAGADPNAPYEEDNKTPLTLAVSRARLPIVQTLVEHEADVTLPDGDGLFPLYAAASIPDGGAIARHLIEHGADVNQGTKGYLGADGKTALMQSAGSRTIDTVRLLMAAGADPKASSGGFTPLHAAALAGDVEIARLLIARGADVNLAQTDGIVGRTPLMCAVHSGTVETAALLIEAGADVDAAEPIEGTTVLMQAIKRARPEFVQLLVQRGATVDSRALALAQKESTPEIVALLTER